MKKYPGLNHKSGSKAAHWKGGRSKNFLGYINIRINKKDVLEHRYLMEKHLKRKLLSNELVHHKNGNKTDNRLENLELMSRSEHMRIHATERYKEHPEYLRGIEKCQAKRTGKYIYGSPLCQRRVPCGYHSME